MKITKYVHSCLLLEKDSEKLLFDPGWMSFSEGRVDPEVFDGVSTVVLTHGHPDHLDVEALRKILAKSGAGVVANGEVAAQLRKEGIEVTVLEEGSRTAGAFTLLAIPAEHQPILADSLPRNTAFLVDERVLNVGDSFDPALLAHKRVEVLVLPVMAPYLTELIAYDFGRRMEPLAVVPVHDGYARDAFLKGRYDTYETFFKKVGIRFHRLDAPGVSVEV